MQDIVERFELLLVLCFVVVEEISNSGTWAPSTAVLLTCARLLMWEVSRQTTAGELRSAVVFLLVFLLVVNLINCICGGQDCMQGLLGFVHLWLVFYQYLIGQQQSLVMSCIGTCLAGSLVSGGVTSTAACVCKDIHMEGEPFWRQFGAWAEGCMPVPRTFATS